MLETILRVIVPLSALLVYLDATNNKIGKIKGHDGFFNLSAGAWSFATLLLWIVALPCYLIKRGDLLAQAKASPVDVGGRGIKLAMLSLLLCVAVFGATIGTLSPNILVTNLPRCNAPETKDLALKLMRQSDIGATLWVGGLDKIQVQSTREKLYDPSLDARACSATITWADGLPPTNILYTVEWQDPSQSQFLVTVVDLDPDQTSSTTDDTDRTYDRELPGSSIAEKYIYLQARQILTAGNNPQTPSTGVSESPAETSSAAIEEPQPPVQKVPISPMGPDQAAEVQTATEPDPQPVVDATEAAVDPMPIRKTVRGPLVVGSSTSSIGELHVANDSLIAAQVLAACKLGDICEADVSLITSNTGAEEVERLYSVRSAASAQMAPGPQTAVITQAGMPPVTDPFFMERLVTESDLMGKTEWELDVMRNEIFARHGRRFNRYDLQQFFLSQPWYQPVYPADAFPSSLLTPIQQQNVQAIRTYQEHNRASDNSLPTDANAAGNQAPITTPSFDCLKARTNIERMVCSVPALAKADRLLADAYQRSIRNSENASEVRARQREWIRTERDVCGDVACLEIAYGLRIAELTGQSLSVRKL